MNLKSLFSNLLPPFVAIKAKVQADPVLAAVMFVLGVIAGKLL